MFQRSTNVDEMLDILDLFRNDMSDGQYDKARATILSKGKSLSDDFDEAIRSEDSKQIVHYFIEEIFR